MKQWHRAARGEARISFWSSSTGEGRVTVTCSRLLGTLFRDMALPVSGREESKVSLISRLRAVVAGDDYLDGELDDFAYDDDQEADDQRATHSRGRTGNDWRQ